MARRVRSNKEEGNFRTRYMPKETRPLYDTTHGRFGAANRKHVKSRSKFLQNWKEHKPPSALAPHILNEK